MNEQLDPTVQPGSFTEAKCPLPECGATLYITWTANRTVYLSDTATGLGDASGAQTAGWEIGCEEGHTILLPFNAVGVARSVEIFGDRSEEYEHDDLARLRRVLGWDELA